ncbi:MAG: TolB family protein [Candidatus Bipolaricaulia bacterium]
MRIVVPVLIFVGLPWLGYAQRLGEPSLVWYTVHTEHFRVTFPMGLDGLAQEAAVAAEDAYQYLLTKLGYAPSGKTDIVLCDATDTVHRELDIFQNRIIICVAQGGLAERFNPKFPSWVQQSVFALYAQLVSADFVFGVSEVLRPLLGKLVLPNLKPPALLTGIGEYLAEEALSTPPDVRPGIGREHRFVRYLVERFGSDFLREWHRLQANDLGATLSLGLWSDYDRIFRRLTGKSFAQIKEEFEALTMAWRPPLSRGSPTGEGPGVRAFIKRDISKHSYLFGDLYLYDPKTRREIRLTENARVYRAALFPDGQKILVARHRWGDQGPVLALLDIKTKQMETLKEFPMHDYFIDSFAISPDGEKIALSIWRRGGFQDIYLMDLTLPAAPLSRGSPTGEGPGVRAFAQLTRDRAVDMTPEFSPDGHFVLFASDRDGSFKPYAYRLADGAFFEVIDSSDPNTWKPVQIEPEPFPPWDGFPDTDYPIMPYDPRPSLEPKILVPLPGLGSISLLTFGSDALRHHLYSVRLGFNWKTLLPSYQVRYENRVLFASVEALITREGLKAHQSITATLPIVTRLSTRQGLSLFYRRTEEDFINHQIGLEWHGSWRVLQNWVEFSVWGVTATRTGQRIWENSFGWRVGITTELSESLRVRVFAQKDGQFGAELELFPEALVRVGVLWDSHRGSIAFYLR